MRPRGPKRWSGRATYALLLPALAIAAGILGYYTLSTAARFAELGEETIAASSLILAREKVDFVEQYIIGADNGAFGVLDVSRPKDTLREWRPVASDVSPSVRAILILDDEHRLLAQSIRGSDEDNALFLATFAELILPELGLDEMRVGRLKHFHTRAEGRTFLFSYKAVRHQGRRRYLILHHDTGYIVRERFPALFSSEEEGPNYNVVDDEGHRVFGPSLAGAGDYVVGARFPTTLYRWRLQIAPEQAELLESHGRTRRFNEVAMIAVSLAIILLGMAFLLYAASKERRLNDLKSEFIANVSHELKTPLSVVRMFAELLLTKRVRTDEKKEQYLEIICRESERLTALIENVLDFAALERGKQTYEMALGDIGEVIARAVETFRFRIEREGTEVTLDLAEDLPDVLLDEQAMVLAIVNLLDNAAKYGEGSPIRIAVETANESISVKVADGGPGIAEDDLKRIFERFYRSRRDNVIRGSGIGLSLVKHIVEAHGGRARAENGPEGGAVVGFTIPLPKTSPRTSMTPDSPPSA